MDKLFLTIVNMSIKGSYVILFVIVARLFMKRAPKVFSYALWLVVLFRLICPFSFKSIFSLMPSNTQAIPGDIIYGKTSQIESGITAIDNLANDSLPKATADASVNPVQIWISLGTVIWLLGVVALLTYSILTTIKLNKKLKYAEFLSDNIYEILGLKTAFVFGIIDPKIYLPMELSERERSYIIKHEQTHIKRFDHIIKPFAFLLLSVHWFNPLVWIAFSLMSKDMELSCDETVIREMGSHVKKDYVTSLLALSTEKKIIGARPLAFGEEDTKGRVKNILNYRRPRFWVVTITAIIVLIVCVGLLSDPLDTQKLLAPETFLEEWEMDVVGLPKRFSTKVPKDWEVKLGEYPEGLYWGLANEFSKDIGLDLTEYKDKKVEVYIYELAEGLPGDGEQAEFIYPSTVTVLTTRDNHIVGAWLNFNLHDIGPSLNKKTLEDITGLSFHEWVEREGYFSHYEKSEDLDELSPIEVIEVFFDSINKGDKTRAIACLGPYSMLDSLTVNLSGNRLYNPDFGYNNSLVHNIVEGHPHSYKLFNPEDGVEIAEIGDRETVTIGIDMQLEWKDDAFNNPGYEDIRFAVCRKYKNGWKIEGLNTGI